MSRRETATEVVRALREAGHEAYLVGGCVRDLLMGAEPGDYDISTSARPLEVRGLFEKTVPVGEAFGVVLVLEGGYTFEVATFRTEGPYEDGRHPSRVEFATAEEDVLRRDFTVNGLLLDPLDPASGNVIDHVGGREDIRRKLIRTIGDPDARFAEDHLRMLRAVRFAANLGFEVEPATLQAVRRHAPLVGRTSAERVREELTKLLTRGGARRGMQLLAETGLLQQVLPEAAAMRGSEQRWAGMRSITASSAPAGTGLPGLKSGTCVRWRSTATQAVRRVMWLPGLAATSPVSAQRVQASSPRASSSPLSTA